MREITENEFKENKSKNQVFSLITEFRGDEITPITIYKKLSGKRKFIFESGERRNLEGRYSFISENPYLEIMGDDKNSIERLRKEININFNLESNTFPYKGGGIGYLGYDTVCFYEKAVEVNKVDELKAPKVRFNFYKRYVVYDHLKNKVYIVDNIFPKDNRDYSEVKNEQIEYFNSISNRTDELELQTIVSKSYNEDLIEDNKNNLLELKYNDSNDEFIKNLIKAKKYIRQGDVFQVVLSRRMIIETGKSPLEIYRRLREDNPSPYMYLLDYEEYQVVGSSPEILVSIKENIITTNPIAGTRKRGRNYSEDLLLENDLKRDSKELAEHVMLVDLSRNDVGKVSKISTVEVKDFMKVEKFSHVMHMTSVVQGELNEEIDGIEALFSCFPAGTVSGAPKIRAMQIIDELESLNRGIYSGAIGYLSYCNNLELCIAIRTIILKNNNAYIQAGAGIVHDSIPEKECEEIDNKLSILKEVIIK
jgi:anthranilate synthase component I